MGLNSSISWTDGTYNPWRGCQKISAGCKKCYAEAGSKRNPMVLGMWEPGKPRVVGSPDYFKMVDKLGIEAARDGCKKRIFCLSYGDFFEDYDGHVVNAKGGTQIVNQFGEFVTGNPFEEGAVPLHLDHIRAYVLGQIARSPRLVWLILTKRPEHIVPTLHRLAEQHESPVAKRWLNGHPPTNVMLMTSVENHPLAEKRVVELLNAPAVMRGLSVEPLLSPVGLSKLKIQNHAYELDCLRGQMRGTITRDIQYCEKINWVIVGGESDPQGEARECNVEWITDIVKQCQAAGVPCFVKQDSGKESDKQGRIPDWAWKIKEFPHQFGGTGV